MCYIVYENRLIKGRMQMNIISRIKKTHWLPFIIQTVIPFFIPFVFGIPDELMAMSIKLIIIVIVAGLDLLFIYAINITEKEDEKISFHNQAARCAYSNIYQLNEIKRDYYINSPFLENDLPQNILPYKAKDYIKQISNSFSNVIAEITQIEKEHISVSFIYHFIDTNEWKWATQKDGTMTLSLDTFIKKRNTLFYQLINPDEFGRLKTVIFYNDKEKTAQEGNYYLSTRDNRHDNIGSILGIKMAFSTNEKILVEGILTISTYGRKFVNSSDENKIKTFQKLLIDDLFPNYQRMLETEMGVLYHEKKLELTLNALNKA